MEQTSTKLWSLLRPPQGPVAPYLDEFARQLNAEGFKPRSISPQVREAAKFSRWLKASCFDLGAVTDEHCQRFLRRARYRTSTRLGHRAVLCRLLALLRRLGLVQPQSDVHVTATPVQTVVSAYGRHLRDEQGLARATCIQYLPFIEQFLTGRFGSDAVDLSALCAADVVGFIEQQARRLSRVRAKCATIALRSFLRYLRYRGEIALDLAAGVPTVPNWSLTGIPRAISADHIRTVLASCRRDNPAGRRDYAILILLARLGLRSGEIVAITLGSIDWERGCLTVAGKGGHSGQLPMPAAVGEAIADYLQHGRPRTSCRTLFLRTNAPIRGLGSQTSIASIVRAAITRAGIETTHHGAHQFRHALACAMLRQGATLTEIGSVLRHRHAKTTGIYAKVDFAALRPLSLPWPGGVR